MKLAEIVFLLLICAVAVALCLHGWLVVGHGPLVIAAPAMLALALLVLSAVRILRSLGIGGDGGEAALQQQYWRELRGSFRPLLWSLSAAPLLLLLGYPLGLAVFVGLYARAFGSGWRGSAVAAVCAFAVVWGGAGGLFGVPIPLLPGWLA